LHPIVISAQATARDGELKQRIQALDANFGVDRQTLLISDARSDADGAGVALLNHRTLRSYAMSDGTTVVLVMQPRPVVEVSIDNDLKNTDRFAALLANPEC
jgi:hypothetical protein